MHKYLIAAFFFFKFIFIKFIFDGVYIIERDALPPVRVERVKEWGKVDEVIASNLLFSCGIWGK